MVGNILIVDDSSIDRRIISNLLNKRLPNTKIFELEDGYGVIEAVKSYDINTIILDIIMPGKSGFEVLAELKDNSDTKDIPVIICTGINNEGNIEKALLQGAYDYFSKPLSEEVMKISLPLKAKNALSLMQRQREIEYLSYHDQLTGLYNRRYFEDELKRIDNHKYYPLSIIVVDINGLKLVNDAFGHKMGDALLIEAAKVLLDSCRSTDVVARLGGDEFIILLPKTSLEDVEDIHIRIKEASNNVRLESIYFSLSVGYACKMDEELNIEKVYKVAEDHMYRKKLFESPSMRGKMIETILSSLHEKSDREAKHSRRVGYYCKLLGEEINLSPNERDLMEAIGVFHDIGKIAIKDSVLEKSQKLTDIEWEEIKKHPEIGYRILSSTNEMAEIAQYVLAHHERWDGNGYPKGLKDREIPIQARIITVADAYDAMITERPYRKPLTMKEAINELKKGAGSQFDPDLVEIFINKVIDKINGNHHD